jgi:hypothetical protein
VIIDKSIDKSAEKLIQNPVTYRLTIGDNTFIRVSKNGSTYWNGEDSLLYTNVTNSNPIIDEMGIDDNSQVYYYVWEDSIDGRIGLLGKKESYKIGGGHPLPPSSFTLSQNFPNPFNPSTKIYFEIPKPVYVKLIVFDILGREVAALINGEMLPGRYIVKFSSDNFASGVYIYQLRAGDFVQSKKMMILR